MFGARERCIEMRTVRGLPGAIKLKTDFEKTFTIMPAAMSAKPMSAERSSACFDQTQATAVMSTIPNPDQMAYTILVGITRRGNESSQKGPLVQFAAEAGRPGA